MTRYCGLHKTKQVQYSKVKFGNFTFLHSRKPLIIENQQAVLLLFLKNHISV